MQIQTADLNLVLRTLAEVRAEIEQMDAATRAEISPRWLARLDEATEPDPWVHGFSVVHAATGRAIGSCGFKGPPAEGVVEIAYGIEPEHQGKGFATQAAEALTQFAFSIPGVRVVCAHTLPQPNASTRVLGKCGFRWVGEVVDEEDGVVWRWERESAGGES